jgi:hypothetical protein
MVTMLPYLPIPPKGYDAPWFWDFLSIAGQERVSVIGSTLTNILYPLAQVQSKEELESLLRLNSHRFLRLKAEMQELLKPSVLAKPDQFSRNAHDYLRKVIFAHADLLGEESLSWMLGAIDSIEGLSNWINEVSKQGVSGIYRVATVVQQIGEPALYTDMCMSALIAVLMNQVTDWISEAIPVLAEAADRYMTEVEDVFLAEPYDADTSQETVSYESLRKDFGL